MLLSKFQITTIHLCKAQRVDFAPPSLTDRSSPSSIATYKPRNFYRTKRKRSSRLQHGARLLRPVPGHHLQESTLSPPVWRTLPFRNILVLESQGHAPAHNQMDRPAAQEEAIQALKSLRRTSQKIGASAQTTRKTTSDRKVPGVS